MHDTPEGRSARWTPVLFRRLLDRIATRPRAAQQPLPPPGERSGHGAESIEPFLRNARDSRPGALE